MPTTRRMRTTLLHRMVPSLSDVLLWPEASSATVPPVLRDAVIDGRTGKMHEFRENRAQQTETEVEVEVEVESAEVHVQPEAEPESEPEPEPEPELRVAPEPEVEPDSEPQLEEDWLLQLDEETEVAATQIVEAATRIAAAQRGRQTCKQHSSTVESLDTEGTVQNPSSTAGLPVSQQLESNDSHREAGALDGNISTVFTEDSGDASGQTALETKFATSLR